jgi:hypothetical protein
MRAMRFGAPSAASLVRPEEKQPKLEAFISRHLESGSSGPGTSILVVARSRESPVVRAIAALCGPIVSAGHPLRIILGYIDHGGLSAGTAAGLAPALECEVRWAKNRRLLEAHEQLVLNSLSCWTGDSMRRDPCKCHALETYVDACAHTTGAATRFFERLWRVCEPLPWSGPSRGRLTPGAVLGVDKRSGISTTRH